MATKFSMQKVWKVKVQGLTSTHGTNHFILRKGKFIVVLAKRKFSPPQVHWFIYLQARHIGFVSEKAAVNLYQ